MLLRLSTPGVFFFWDRFGRWRLIRNVIYCFQLARTGKLQPGSCLSVYPPGRSTRTTVIKNKIIIIMNSVGFCRSFYPPGRSTHTPGIKKREKIKVLLALALVLTLQEGPRTHLKRFFVIKKIKIKNLNIIGLVFTLQETIVKKREKKNYQKHRAGAVLESGRGYSFQWISGLHREAPLSADGRSDDRSEFYTYRYFYF